MRAPGPAVSPEVDVLVQAAISGPGPGRARAAGRLMSLLESEPHRLPDLFLHLPQEFWPRPQVIGITGAPGSGKSTLVDAVIAELRACRPGVSLGVIAVDPSSPFTGGAVLGDRVRMMRHATDPSVFIRSMATRGHLGGLALGVKGVLRVMGLIGCDVVLLETVGVGQSEVEVASIADRVGVVLAPGAGDSIQMLKAGLMEVGDLFIVNKADAEGAATLYRSLLQVLRLAPGCGEPPRVLLASATRGTGIGAVVDALVAAGEGRRGGRCEANDVRGDVREAVLDAARRRLQRALEKSPDRLEAVLCGTTSVDQLVTRLFAEQRDG